MVRIKAEITLDGQEYNAEVGRAETLYLGIEDHGMFMLDIEFSFGTSRQGLGRIPKDETLAKTIKDILYVFGVNEWSQIRGKSIYVLREKTGDLICGFVSLDGQRSFLFT